MVSRARSMSTSELAVTKCAGLFRTEALAELEGWDLEDLVVSQAYGSLQRRKNLLLESIELEGK